MTATRAKAPPLAAFSLDAYGQGWGVGYSDESDPDPEPPMMVIAMADQLTDEEVENLSLFPRDCGDWSAWADVHRIGDWVAYHIVVNSDSGGFIDTMESGVLSIEEARRTLPNLLDYWRDVASEHLVMSETWFTNEEIEDDLKTIQRWKDHLKEVLA